MKTASLDQQNKYIFTFSEVKFKSSKVKMQTSTTRLHIPSRFSVSLCE